MATLPASRLLRAEEYAELDGVPGFRDELIEGEHVVSPSPKLAHGRVVERLDFIIGQQLEQIAQAAGISDIQLRVEREQGWYFQTATGTDSVLEPDLMVVRELDSQRAIKADGWFQGIPVIVVDVVSPSERKSRRLQKVGLYLEMGVQHISKSTTPVEWCLFTVLRLILRSGTALTIGSLFHSRRAFVTCLPSSMHNGPTPHCRAAKIFCAGSKLGFSCKALCNSCRASARLPDLARAAPKLVRNSTSLVRYTSASR